MHTTRTQNYTYALCLKKKEIYVGNAKIGREEAFQRSLSVRLANLEVTHKTGGTTARERYCGTL